MSEHTTEPAAENKSSLYWDDQHIEEEAALFPSYLRDSYRRVKILCRDKYARNLDAITEAFAAVGAARDKTTWSRIFKRGRWNHNSEGEPLPSPIVAPKKLAEEFEALLSETRVELQRGQIPFSETLVWNLVDRFITKKMRPGWVNKFGVIVGPTGLQKSACFREKAARDPNIRHVESPESAAPGHMLSLIAMKYGISPNRSTTEKRFKIYECFGPDKCLILDNTQDFRKGSATSGVENFNELMKFFRWLQDERRGTIIYSITPSDEDRIFPANSIFMEQFEGRAGGRDGFLQLPDQNPKADFVTIAQSLGLKDAERHADRLQEIGTQRGRIRTFYEVLQNAHYAAQAKGQKFTVDHVEVVMEERTEAAKRSQRGRGK